MADNEEFLVFLAAFRVGFSASREGFNGECGYVHLAPTEAEYAQDVSVIEASNDELEVKLAELAAVAFQAITKTDQC
jgi:hypothetical protein